MPPVRKKTPDNLDETINEVIISHLLENSKAAIMGAVELHNKPIFPCRYEVSIILTINAWELAMKAFIQKNYRAETSVFEADGTTKPFDKCLNFIWNKLGKEFSLTKESVEQLYKYRCDIMHYYADGIELILYTILRPNIIFLAEFLNKHFGIDLGEDTNLIILPLGFRRTISPTDFLSEKSLEGDSPVKEFITGLVKSMERLKQDGINDGLCCGYSMFLEKENNPKHADLIIAFTKNPAEAKLTLNKVTTIGGFTNEKNAPKVQIEEIDVWEIFNIPHKQFMNTAKKVIPGFKETRENMKTVSIKVKSDPNCFRVRLLDPSKPNGSRKGFYSNAAIKKLTTEFNGRN